MLSTAARVREAGITHRQALNIVPPDTHIRRQAYYNNGYNRNSAGQQQHVIDRNFSLLDLAKMHCYPRYTEVPSTNGKSPTRRLDASFFTTDEQVRQAKRFASNFLIQVDATFSTNSHKMPLISNIAVSNTGATFVLGLCFTRSENELDVSHNLRCMQDLMWNDCPPLPK